MTDSLVARVLIGLVVFAFVGWGFKDLLQTNHNADLVSFLHAQNITEQEFLSAKAAETKTTQPQNNLSPAQATKQQLNLNQLTLKKLIDANILTEISNFYDLDLSDSLIIEFLKQLSAFKNDQGQFDINIFKSSRSAHQPQAEYLKSLKRQILHISLINIFLETFKTPEIMVSNIIDYVAEARSLDLVQMNLRRQPPGLIIPPPTNQQLEQFYHSHRELLRLPERRSLAYVKITKQFISQKIVITDQQLVTYYDNNLAEFDGKNFNQVRPQITETLKQQKLDELNLELIKNLEDNVASGATLAEIAEKYGLKLTYLNDVTYQDLLSSRAGAAEMAAVVFELAEQEVSYPVDLQDKSGILLAELKAIKPSLIEDFNLANKQITTLWHQQQITEANLKLLEKVSKQYATHRPAKKLAASGITINQKMYLVRADLPANAALPAALLTAIFETKSGITPVFQAGNQAYFAYIKSTKTDQAKVAAIRKSASQNISAAIRSSLIDELISHFIRQNNIKINYKSSVLSAQSS